MSTLFHPPLYFHGIEMKEIYSSKTFSKNISILQTIIKDPKEKLTSRVEALYYITMFPNYSSYISSDVENKEKNTIENKERKTDSYCKEKNSIENLCNSITSDSTVSDLDKFFIVTKIVPSSISIKKLFVNTKAEEIKVKCCGLLWNVLNDNEKKLLTKYNDNSKNTSASDNKSNSTSGNEGGLSEEISFINDIRDTIFNFSLTFDNIKVEEIKEAVLDYYSDSDKKQIIGEIIDEYFFHT